MHKIVTLTKTNIQATLKKVRRARHMRIAVHQDGRVVVTAPHYVSYREMERFLHEHGAWVHQKIPQETVRTSQDARKEFERLKERARSFVRLRINYFNQHYGFQYNRISIRNSRTRWGSCSQLGNLNFSCRIILLPQALADYVIVHELCHLKELNHSFRFWNLVKEMIPNYRETRKLLKTVPV